MTDTSRPGAHLVQGHLFFRMPDRSTILCKCIPEPFSRMIVEMWHARLALPVSEDRVEIAKLVAHMGRRARLSGGKQLTTDDVAAAIMRGERAPVGCEVPPTEVVRLDTPPFT